MIINIPIDITLAVYKKPLQKSLSSTFKAALLDTDCACITGL
jgi:hypothetical protein